MLSDDKASEDGLLDDLSHEPLTPTEEDGAPPADAPASYAAHLVAHVAAAVVMRSRIYGTFIDRLWLYAWRDGVYWEGGRGLFGNRLGLRIPMEWMRRGMLRRCRRGSPMIGPPEARLQAARLTARRPPRLTLPIWRSASSLCQTQPPSNRSVYTATL